MVGSMEKEESLLIASRFHRTTGRGEISKHEGQVAEENDHEERTRRVCRWLDYSSCRRFSLFFYGTDVTKDDYHDKAHKGCCRKKRSWARGRRRRRRASEGPQK
jgi:hypothetical protein